MDLALHLLKLIRAPASDRSRLALENVAHALRMGLDEIERMSAVIAGWEERVAAARKRVTRKAASPWCQ